MSYMTDVMVVFARADERNIDKIQEFINSGYYEQKFTVRDSFYSGITLMGTFKSFIRSKFVEFLMSLDWELEDHVQLLVRGEEDDKFKSWGLKNNPWDIWTWDCYKNDALRKKVKECE